MSAPRLARLRRYPLTLCCLLAIWVLCFCHPPRTSLDGVVGIDKLLHTLMYLGTCGVMWWEYASAHKRISLRRVMTWTLLLPILMSGAIELLQEYATSHRGGEWLDFAANTTGVVLAYVAGRYLIWPLRHRGEESQREPISPEKP